MPHEAIWINQDGSPEYRTIAESYHPGPGQVLVSVSYSGINPADLKHVRVGMKDIVAGYDYSGTVVTAAPGSRFKPGDRVAGTTQTGISRGSRCGSHQHYIVAEESMAFAVPSSMSMIDAAGLDIVLRTAIVGLYARLGLPLPWNAGPANEAGALLIWGAATGVGLCALQLAKISGTDPIYVTASSRHHGSLKELGATHCFGYKEESVWEDIKSAIASSGKPLDKVLDTIGPTSTGHIGDRCFELTSNPETAKVATCGPGGQRASFFTAMPDWDADMRMPDGSVVVAKKKPDETEVMLKVLNWVVDNYGKAFKLPRVRTVPWKEAISELKRSAEGKNSFEKTVVDHGMME